MNRKNFNNQGGFIALISIIVISVILAAITFTLSTSGFFLRFNVLDSEFKKISLDLAESCVQKAMLDLANNAPSFPQTVSVGSSSCKICSITGPLPSGPFIVLTRAVHRGSYTNISANITRSGSNFTVNSWDEQPNYAPPGTCNVP